MPGPYDNTYLNQSLRGDGLSVLDAVGGYAKLNRSTPPNTTQFVDANEHNHITQALGLYSLQ